VETLGEEPGQLAGALEQLADAFTGERITPQIVAQQFRGLGEQRVWDLCDRAFVRDLPGAIRALRSIEASGDDALKTLGGISSRLRDLIRVRALPDRMAPAEAAKAAGLRFDWQARRYQQQARNFSMAQLVTMHARVTEADRALKSGATGDIVMPVLVTDIATQGA
jgi:DNA polymerase III delta subunit